MRASSFTNAVSEVQSAGARRPLYVSGVGRGSIDRRRGRRRGCIQAGAVRRLRAGGSARPDPEPAGRGVAADGQRFEGVGRRSDASWECAPQDLHRIQAAGVIDNPEPAALHQLLDRPGVNPVIDERQGILKRPDGSGLVAQLFAVIQYVPTRALTWIGKVGGLKRFWAGHAVRFRSKFRWPPPAGRTI